MLSAAACMTWKLAKSGNDFIAFVITGANLVPTITFSAVSVDDLLSAELESVCCFHLRRKMKS